MRVGVHARPPLLPRPCGHLMLADLYTQLHQHITAHPPPPNVRPWEWTPPHPTHVTFHTTPWDGSLLGQATDHPPTITIANHPYNTDTTTHIMLHEMAHLTRIVADWTGAHDPGWHRLHNSYRHTLNLAAPK